MKRALALAAAGLLTGAALAAAAVAPAELRLTKYNRVYENLAGELAPIEAPPVRIRLSSPSQAILVKDNLARLTPLGGGRFDGRVEIELLGKGRLVVDVDLGESTQRLEDEVLLPRQRLAIDGVARIERAAGGYRVMAERLPPSLRVEIRSRIVNEVIDLCSGASLLSLGALDCGPLARALERPEIPLAGVARELFLPDGELTAEERATLDRLLAAP
jgi:hypothetical protein